MEAPPPRTLHNDYVQGPTVVLLGGALSYERGTPVRSPQSSTPDPQYSSFDQQFNTRNPRSGTPESVHQVTTCFRRWQSVSGGLRSAGMWVSSAELWVKTTVLWVRTAGLWGSYEVRPPPRPTNRDSTVTEIERSFLTDNLLVRVHWIIEMSVVERPCAMGV